MKYLSECDLLVYDLHSGNPRDVDLAIQSLKKYNSEDGDKVLILISSLMVWNKTPSKLKEIKEGKEAEEAGEIEGEDGEKPEDKGEKEDEGALSEAEDSNNKPDDEDNGD